MQAIGNEARFGTSVHAGAREKGRYPTKPRTNRLHASTRI